MKSYLGFCLRIAVVIEVLFINVSLGQTKGMSIAEDVIMNVYDNGELNEIEFNFWKLRGWIPENYTKSWLRIDYIQIINQGGYSNIYPRKYELSKIVKTDSVSYNFALENENKGDTLFLSIVYDRKIAPNMDKVIIKSARLGESGAGPEVTFMPDTTSKTKDILPLKNEYIENIKKGQN